ncbi:MAG TPA: hypothetical protein VLG50_03280 [Candidatus Saccharimonadales bacterium]|nr:hypothetical protein [Candidatus Saccharimonadales bacterium]
MLRLYIFTINGKGKINNDMFLCDNMIDVTRTLLTYKPKRGYEFQGSEITAI